MNLWFRLLWLLMTSRLRPRLTVPGGVSRLRFRTWFNDLDINGHVNNGRYWTLFDLGRTDVILRSGLMSSLLKHKWTPIVGSGAIRFRRELKLFQPFMLETRILTWTQTQVVFEQRILTGDGQTLASRGLVLAGLYDRGKRCYVPVEVVFDSVGARTEGTPPVDPSAQKLLELDATMKADTTA
ncbi:thioesterase family protein [Pseudomonas amygdali]|uniref:acyl-CoA thioesterase n=1 Tax=Pseudomonas amygdali TaxID=47877 RepID=UPI001CD9168F|nr:thioesterase family protein [Pseudomonas amygdali]UBT80439.1 thioesterase family protein [Pseudomonas amygdali]